MDAQKPLMALMALVVVVVFISDTFVAGLQVSFTHRGKQTRFNLLIGS